MSSRLNLMPVLVIGLLAAASSAFAQSDRNEIGADVSVLSRTLTGVPDFPRATVTSWKVSYARFFNDYFAAGPLFKVTTVTDDHASWYFGGLGRIYFREQDTRVIPVVEFNAVRSFRDRYIDNTTYQLLGGLVFPMGAAGGRFRIAPYYTRVNYPADSIAPSFNGYGVSWSISVVF